MFADYIDDLTICGDEAAEVFPNIRKSLEHPDASFLATLRALLPQRMEPVDILCFGLDRHEPTDYFQTMTSRKKIKLIFRQALDIENRLIVVSLERSNAGIMDLVKTRTAEFLTWFRYLPECSYFLSQKGCRKEVFISEKNRSAVVVGEAITLPDWHYIQSVIPLLLPWYFTGPRSGDDNAILDSLTRASSREYIAVMERVSAGMDLRTIKVGKMLSGLAREFMQGKIDEVTAVIQAIDNEIISLNQSLSQKIYEKSEKQITLCGLHNMEAPQDAMMADFFIKNKSLHVIRAGRGVVEYVVTGYLNSYEQHLVDSGLKNKSSLFYTNTAGAKVTAEDTIKLIRAVFSPNPQCKLRVYSAFELTLDRSIKPKQFYSFPCWLNTYLPNPHIDGSACLGGNAQFINQAMSNQDYVTAIMQTMSANRNINFADGVIGPRFIILLRNNDPVCVEMRDGTVLRPSEAVKLLGD